MQQYKIKVNLCDQFSGATTTKELTVPADKLQQLEQIQINGSVMPIFDKKQQIRYNWTIEEIERLN